MIEVPADFAERIADLIHGAGEAAVYLKEPVINIMVSVQSPIDVQYFADASQDVFVVFISANDLPFKPQLMDKLVIRGSERTVIESEETVLSGATVVHRLVVKG